MDDPHILAIDQVIKRSRKLSFSSMNSLLHSPKAFLTYLMGDKVITDAMEMGELFHCLVLEPDTFKNRYIVFKKPVPLMTMAKKENKEAYSKMVQDNPDLSVIKQPDFETAQAMANVVLDNKISGALIKEKKRAEVQVSFEYSGWDFTGFIDLDTYFEGKPTTADLKKVPDASPRKVYYTARDRNLAMQGFLYNYAITGNEKDAIYRPYFIIACDGKDVSVHKFEQDTIIRGKLELDKAIEALETLLFLYDQDGIEVFNAGLEFWAENKKYYVI